MHGCARIDIGFPQSIGIFRTYGYTKISNYIYSMVNLKDKKGNNVNIIPIFSMNNDNGVESLKNIKKWLMKNMIDIYLYCQKENKNDFFLLHCVTSAWSICQILQTIVNIKVKKYQLNANHNITTITTIKMTITIMIKIENLLKQL